MDSGSILARIPRLRMCWPFLPDRAELFRTCFFPMIRMKYKSRQVRLASYCRKASIS